MLVDLSEFSWACPCFRALKRFLPIFRVHVSGPDLLKSNRIHQRGRCQEGFNVDEPSTEWPRMSMFMGEWGRNSAAVIATFNESMVGECTNMAMKLHFANL